MAVMARMARRALSSPTRPGAQRTTFVLRDPEGLPNVVAGQQLEADDSREVATWKLLKRAMDEKQEVYARVLQRTNHGYLLDILGRVAFMPHSFAGGRPIPSKSARPRGEGE